jgi:Tfp pilus assembly protein PilO
MAENRLTASLFQRKLTKREQLIAFLTMLTLVGGLVYRFPYAALDKNMAVIQANIRAEEKAILDLSVQFADLKVLEAEIKAGARSGVAGWELVDQKGVILFLEDVSAEAKRQGVNLVSVHPSQEVEKEKYKEVSVSLDLKGRYRELAEYFKHIENQSRLVNIRKIRVEACPDSSSVCATQLEAVTYMAK